MSLREREFIEAARSLGARRGRIYVKELLPHLWAPILVYTTMILPQNISAEAALGFLGVGINPPRVSLGTLLNDSVVYALPDPSYFLFPGLAVFLMVLAFNLVEHLAGRALVPPEAHERLGDLGAHRARPRARRRARRRCRSDGQLAGEVHHDELGRLRADAGD